MPLFGIVTQKKAVSRQYHIPPLHLTKAQEAAEITSELPLVCFTLP